MKKRMAIAILALIAVFGSIFGWKAVQAYFMGQYFANFQPPPVTVSSGVARTESWQPRLEAVGSLSAVYGVEVAAEVSGVVKDIRFQSGGNVETGALLVQLDDASEQAELPGLRARLKLAERNLQRAREVVGKGLAAQETQDATQSEYDQALSAVRTRETLIAKKAIRAPFSGTLGIRRVNAGEYLQPGTPVVTLQALNPLYVNFTLPQQQLGRIQTGQTLEIHSSAWPGKSFGGKITAISPKIDADTRNFAVQGEIDNPGGELRPGMFTEIAVLAGQPETFVTVPRNAITYSLYGDSVFVIVDKDGTKVAQQKFVKTGPARDGRIAVTEGLQEGEHIVTAGQLKLQDGARVNIDNDVALAD